MIRKAMMSRIIKKREVMLKYINPICPNIMKKLEKNKKVLKYYLATWAGDSMYEVEHSPNQYIVDLEKHKCSYFRWQLTGISYAHPMHCIYFLKKRLKEFVHIYYNRETYLRIYSNFLQPLNRQNM